MKYRESEQLTDLPIVKETREDMMEHSEKPHIIRKHEERKSHDGKKRHIIQKGHKY